MKKGLMDTEKYNRQWQEHVIEVGYTLDIDADEISPAGTWLPRMMFFALRVNEYISIYNRPTSCYEHVYDAFQEFKTKIDTIADTHPILHIKSEDAILKTISITIVHPKESPIELAERRKKQE